MVAVPPVVVSKARLVGASEWLCSLDDLVAGLEEEWEFSLGEPYADSTEAFVARARLGDGTPAVLKVILPQGATARQEITALALDGGRGCATAFRHDADRGAVLLERLGPSLVELDVPSKRRHEILWQAASRMWRRVGETPLPSGADKAAFLAERVREGAAAQAGAISTRATEYALSCAESRRAAHDEARSVLVHGDVHQWNALQAGDRFKLVDPDGLVAEPEYDLGVIMREDPIELLAEGARTRSRRLAELSGLDEQAIFEWGVVERVATGLLASGIGLEPVGRDMLRAAEVVAEEEYR